MRYNCIRREYAPLWRFGVTQTNDDGKLFLHIGVEADNGEYIKGNVGSTIPGGTWAVFPVKGKLQYSPDDCNQHIYREMMNSVINRRRLHDRDLMQPLDKTFARAEVEWLDKSGYERAGNYEMMVYPLGDTESDDYCCEAWIPVRKK